MIRKRRDTVEDAFIIGGTNRPDVPSYLGYGFAGCRKGQYERWELDGLDLVVVPLDSSVSFLDFDGVVVIGGAFAARPSSDLPLSMAMDRLGTASSPADLDRRHREAATLLAQGRPLIFLVPELPAFLVLGTGTNKPDLLPRILDTYGMVPYSVHGAHLVTDCEAPEFQDYCDRHGTAYVALTESLGESVPITPLAYSENQVVGAVISDDLYLLPCISLRTQGDAVDAAESAIRSVLAYRRRVSTEVPDWMADLSFSSEKAMRVRILELQAEIDGENQSIARQVETRSQLLMLSGDALVKAVIGRLRDHLRLPVVIMPTNPPVEDGAMQDSTGRTTGVVEIKGVRGSFTRGIIAQADDHRRRNRLPGTAPAVAIINTLLGASTLADKDQPPDSMLIQLAAEKRVLLMRTLDLVNCLRQIDAGIAAPERFAEIILSRVGWLRVGESVFDVRAS